MKFTPWQRLRPDRRTTSRTYRVHGYSITDVTTTAAAAATDDADKVNDAAWPTQLSHSAQLEYENDSYTVGLTVACLQPSIHLGPAEQVRRLWIMDSHPPAAISGSADCSVTRLKAWTSPAGRSLFAAQKCIAIRNDWIPSGVVSGLLTSQVWRCEFA